RTARRAPTTAPGILVVPTLVGTLGADQGRHLPEGATCADQGAWDPGRCQPWLAPCAPTKVGIYRSARRAVGPDGYQRASTASTLRRPAPVNSSGNSIAMNSSGSLKLPKPWSLIA